MWDMEQDDRSRYTMQWTCEMEPGKSTKPHPVDAVVRVAGDALGSVWHRI